MRLVCNVVSVLLTEYTTRGLCLEHVDHWRRVYLYLPLLNLPFGTNSPLEHSFTQNGKELTIVNLHSCSRPHEEPDRRSAIILYSRISYLLILLVFQL